MWAYKTSLIRVINLKRDEIIRSCAESIPQNTAEDMIRLISGRVYVRNQDILNAAQLSNKTVIKYLKQLERDNILHSVKDGRDVYYFNTAYVGMISDLVEE